jgi:hypothetical protein
MRGGTSSREQEQKQPYQEVVSTNSSNTITNTNTYEPGSHTLISTDNLTSRSYRQSRITDFTSTPPQTIAHMTEQQ